MGDWNATGDRSVAKRRHHKRSLANSSAEWPRDAEALLATLAVARGWQTHNADAWRKTLENGEVVLSESRRDITLATAPAIGSVDVPLGSDLRQKVLRQAQIQKTMAKLTASLACIDCLETHAGLKLLERRIRHGSKLLEMSQKAQF
jgi:hypothetical protein